MIFFGRLNAHDVICMLEDDNGFHLADIFLDPPPPDQLTNEDSNEECGGITVDNLNGRQLSAGVEVTITGGVRTRDTADADNESSSSDEIVSTL